MRGTKFEFINKHVTSIVAGHVLSTEARKDASIGKENNGA